MFSRESYTLERGNRGERESVWVIEDNREREREIRSMDLYIFLCVGVCEKKTVYMFIHVIYKFKKNSSYTHTYSWCTSSLFFSLIFLLLFFLLLLLLPLLLCSCILLLLLSFQSFLLSFLLSHLLSFLVLNTILTFPLLVY